MDFCLLLPSPSPLFSFPISNLTSTPGFFSTATTGLGNTLGAATSTLGKGVSGVTTATGNIVSAAGKGVGDTVTGVTQGLGDTTKGKSFSFLFLVGGGFGGGE